MDLVPLPRSLEALPGSLDLRGGGSVAAAGPLEAAGRLAARWLDEAFELLGERGRFSSPGVPGLSPVLSFAEDPSLRGEEYRLVISPSGILAEAGTAEGALRAASTLRQIALSEGPVLGCARIEDSPRFAWRGMMLDCCRNFFRVEFIERMLDLMALHKLNRFHWHLTDDQAWRLEIPSHPEIAERGSRRQDRRYGEERLKEGSYSPADVERVVRFAAERGIVVVPEIETPGHASALLASHPELSCRSAAEPGVSFEPEDRYGVFEEILCAGTEGTFALLAEVFGYVASAFPGPWVHAGGDEAPKARWLACPRCRSAMEREGFRSAAGEPEPERLQGWFMDRVARMLAERGKRMIGWDEILDGGMSSDAIVMSWRGSSGGVAAARSGRDAIMAPQTHACYLDHKHLDLPEEPGNLGFCTVEESYSFDPAPEGLSDAEAERILGGQANIWTEFIYFGRNVEYMAFPRLCALSEAFWSPREMRSFESFESRLKAHGRRLDLLDVARYRGPLR